MTHHTLHLGDCRQILQTLPEKSVNCCVTSPPYFGLRDYGMAEQIGLEPTPEQFVAELVAVFREVLRVLRDDGTLWLNLGDSYNAYNANRGASTSISDGSAGRDHPQHSRGLTTTTLKNKDLIGIPWRVAFALQADGWYLRQDIIWHKPNPMPESVRDRCTKAHEYIFLLSKSARYFYDADAIKEPIAESTKEWGGGKKGWGAAKKDHHIRSQAAIRNGQGRCGESDDGMRNRRSVWTVTSYPYKGAHFATFPPALVEPCILAGCPVGGTVLDPFSGSATTGQVALANARSYIGCELNPDYHELAQRRLDGAQLGLSL